MAGHPFYPGGIPKMNHVAMSVPADLLDETGRADLCRYFKRGARLRRAADDDRGPPPARVLAASTGSSSSSSSPRTTR